MSSTTADSEYPLRALLACAIALPMMCAYQRPPLPAFYSQAIAVALWSMVLWALAMGVNRNASQGRRARQNGGRWRWASIVAPTTLWALLAASVCVHVALGFTPNFIAAPIALNLGLALLLSAAVALNAPDPARIKLWLQALLIGILIAALFNACVAAVQMLTPNWADDVWIARSAPPSDRAAGSLRQPNQLATLMLWGLLATSYFWRRRPLLWAVFSLPLLAALVATGSRTGMVSLLFIAVVALARSRRVRAWGVTGWILLAAACVPLLWFAENIFTRTTANTAMSLRLALWRDVIDVMSQQPWWGVGWGQLNFVWTLTPRAARAADVFDHAHSLPLHLAAELGLPLALLCMGLLAALLWRARRALASFEGITLGLLIATVLLHSLIEYPLWFSYFLLPSAMVLACFVSLQPKVVESETARHHQPNQQRFSVLTSGFGHGLKLAAVVCLASVAFARHEYQKATAIHRAVGQPEALAVAVEKAQGSRLYGHFGDYAAIMLAGESARQDLFNRPIRHVLDERLLAAYARMLARSGDGERAAYVVARAREFPPDLAFADLPTASALESPKRSLSARDFRR